tara:strand:- start:332 stop:607 length:276 start_codon:yes stop_codon:yes gene_type:complete
LFREEKKMKETRTAKSNYALSSEASKSCFVSSYSKTLEITLNDYDKNGVYVTLEVELPIELARNLCDEMTRDIVEFDDEMIKKAQAEAEVE